jgi:hypothetical protein
MTAGVDRTHILHADALQFFHRPLRAPSHIVCVLRERADTGDGEVSLQLLDVLIAVRVDEVDDVVHNRPILSPSSRALSPSTVSGGAEGHGTRFQHGATEARGPHGDTSCLDASLTYQREKTRRGALRAFDGQQNARHKSGLSIE